MSDAPPFPPPLEGPRFRVESAGAPGGLQIIRRSDGQPVGCISIRVDGDSLHIQALSIAEPHRGYGAGSEAARLVIDAARGRFDRITAWAPPHLGLAVYFWFRMGLHPVPGEGPDGGLLFEHLNRAE